MSTVPQRKPPSVQFRSLRGQIAEVLQDAIITGEYQPGQRLVERELITRFKVSSIPVREALQELEMRGLVSKQHNRGCSVVSLTAEQEEKLYALRAIFEPVVVEWAAQRYVAERDRAPLQKTLRQLNAAAEEKDTAEFFRQNMVFHRLLWNMSQNEFAVRILESMLSSLVAMALMRAKRNGALDLKAEAKKHQLLFKAIDDGQIAEARHIVAEIASSDGSRIKDSAQASSGGL